MKATIWALSVALLAFDAHALWLGLHPRVDRAYRDYYIAHTTDVDAFVAQERWIHPRRDSPDDMPALRPVGTGR